MLVRDRTIPKREYKGRLTEALDELCPCRPCYNAHNCSTDPYRYWDKPDMRCVTRDNGGCPQPLPMAIHIWNRWGNCRRCKADVKYGDG